MKLTTTRFGTIEVSDDEALDFPEGIIGFPDCRRYIVLDHDTGIPLRWLQAVERGDLAFPVMDAYTLLPDYMGTVSPADLVALGVGTGKDLVTFVILTIPRGAPELTTANLRAPVVVNPATRTARQVLVLEDYPIRYPLSDTSPVSLECAR